MIDNEKKFFLPQISHSVQATELQRYPYLRRRLDEVIGKFLHDGVKPAERMITNIIEIEVISCFLPLLPLLLFVFSH